MPPTRFRTAARHYLEGRPPYASSLIRRVVQWCGLGPSHRLLDLGCGPGPLALAFAPFVAQVVAIDPEPVMLTIARAEAERAGRAIEFRAGSSDDLGPDLGVFRLVVIGRAFHWMERPATLARLDALIEPGGAVVLFGTEHPKATDNAWTDSFDRLIDRYSQGDAARAARRGPGWLSNETVLLDSQFPYLERVSVIERRTTPVDHLVQRALSQSSVSQGLSGTGADDVAREVREAMAPFARDGVVAEVVESRALIARREEMGDPDSTFLAHPHL